MIVIVQVESRLLPRRLITQVVVNNSLRAAKKKRPSSHRCAGSLCSCEEGDLSVSGQGRAGTGIGRSSQVFAVCAFIHSFVRACVICVSAKLLL